MVIVGGGIAGLIAARAAVGRAGRITVVDPRPDPRVTKDATFGRVDLVGPRVMAAVDALGIGDAVRSAAVRLLGERGHASTGSYDEVSYARGPLYAIDRERLRGIIVAALSEQESVDLRFERAVVSLDPESGRVAVARAGSITDGVIEVEADLLIGADGADSTVRDALLRGGGSVTRDEHQATWRLLPMRAPAPTHPLAADRLHRWSSSGAAIVALPDGSGLLSGVLILRAGVTADDDPALWLARTFPSAVAHATISPAAIMEGRATPIIETRVGRLAGGRCVLIGDAAGVALPAGGTGTTMAVVSAAAIVGAMDGEGELADCLAAYEAVIRPEYAAAAAIGEFAMARLLAGNRPDPLARLRPARRVPLEAAQIAGPSFTAALPELFLK